VIFDPAWLYEQGNTEDFTQGLARLSTHVYANSISGGGAPGKVGHCAWNRTYGALLVPDPAGSIKEVLHFITPHDPRLFNNKQGAAWNFPACRNGEVKVKLHIAGVGLRLSLTDRWFNPCDEYVGELAQCSTIVTKEMLPETPFWNDVTLTWDLDKKTVRLAVNGAEPTVLLICGEVSPAGFSYLHLQTTANEPDYEGVMVMALQQQGR